MPLLNMFIAIVASIIVIALLARYLPRTSILPPIRPDDLKSAGPVAWLARRDNSPLRSRSARDARHGAVPSCDPAAKARFADHVVDVVTEGEFIAAANTGHRHSNGRNASGGESALLV